MPGMSIDTIRQTEERGFNAWPALQTRLMDGWVLRFADGYTKRANSINAWRPTQPLTGILETADALYADQNLPLIVRLSPLAGAHTDAELAARGYALCDRTYVMSGPVVRAPCTG